MSDNVYEAPTATLIEQPEETPPFYVISRGKFWLLYVITLSMYQLYWFYRHWSNHKLHTQSDIWPAPRALFSIFFSHSLFRNIDEKLQEDKTNYVWSPSNMASLYVLGVLVQNICSSLSERSIGSPYTDLLWMLSIPLMAWPLYMAQKAANMASGDPEGKSNSRLTGANFAWIVVFALFWILMLIGLFEIADIPVDIDTSAPE